MIDAINRLEHTTIANNRVRGTKDLALIKWINRDRKGQVVKKVFATEFHLIADPEWFFAFEVKNMLHPHRFSDAKISYAWVEVDDPGQAFYKRDCIVL